MTRHSYDYNTRPPLDYPSSPDTWAALELSTNTSFRAVTPVGTNTGSYGHHLNRTYTARSSASYVTGSHNFKAGLDLLAGLYREWGLHSNGDILVTLFNGTPRSLTLVAHPLDNEQKLNADVGVFAQDWLDR